MLRSLSARLALGFTALVLVASASVAALSIAAARDLGADLQAQDLAAQARLIAHTIAGDLSGGADAEGLSEKVASFASALGAEIALLNADGIVVADSGSSLLAGGYMGDLVEFRKALLAGSGTAVRASTLTGEPTRYIATTALEAGRLNGFVRIGVSEAILRRLPDSFVRRTWYTATAAGLVGSAIAALAALYFTSPIRDVVVLARELARGNLGRRIRTGNRGESGELATALNQMADSLQQTLGRYREESDRAQALLDTMQDGVVIVSPLGEITLLNSAAARILALPSVQVALGRSAASVIRDNELMEVLRRTRTADQTASATTALLASGRWVRGLATPVRGGPSGVSLLLIQDLTDMRRLEVARRDFVANISHDLRTPLASLRALVETLDSGALEDTQAARRFLSRMLVEVDDLTQMVQELLELSRIESGEVPLNPVAFSIAEVMSAVAGRFALQAQRAKLEIHSRIPSDLPLVWADPDRIAEVIGNLLHNAIKFTLEGGGITTSAEVTDAEVIVSVEDTGVGIAPEDLPRVFERFFKSDRSRSTQGIGLGLSITKHLIAAHGGRIWADSRLGQGSRFNFSLPRADRTTEPDPPPGPTAAP